MQHKRRVFPHLHSLLERKSLSLRLTSYKNKFIPEKVAKKNEPILSTQLIVGASAYEKMMTKINKTIYEAKKKEMDKKSDRELNITSISLFQSFGRITNTPHIALLPTP